MWWLHVYFFTNIVLHSVLNVTVNAASVFSEVKFMDCLHRAFDGYLALSIVSTRFN